MKKYSILVICLWGLFAVSCHSSGSNRSSPKQYGSSDKPIGFSVTGYPDQYPVFSVAETAFDFDTIHSGEVVQHNFRFKNTGSKPLVIQSATSTCGCTVPSFPTKPVPPGQEGNLKVVFNSAGKSGRQVKPIFITANTMPSHFQLKITSEVLPSK